jgi:hypothetical protein
VFKDSKPYVLEAVGPVKETGYVDWIGQGRNSRFLALRLNESYRAKIPAFVTAARAFLGRPYDMHMDLDDAKIYCSELLYKAFKTTYAEELGKTQTLGELNWKPNEVFIRALEAGKLPLDRVMITPAALVVTDKATRVFSNF